MKKWKIWIALGALLLSGCRAEETPVFETVGGDACAPQEKPAAGTVEMLIPESAAAQTMAEGAQGELYTWDGNTLQIQTLDAGDIQKTIETVTGMDYEALTVMSYEKNGMTCYQTVWSAAGEEGTLLGRALIADDGNYHYCVSLLSPEEQDTRDVYDRLCASFNIRSGDAGK